MTGRAFRTAVVLALVFVGGLAQPLPSGAGSGAEVWTVLSVADGDTLTVATPGGERVKVRLYGIDAPEIRHKDTRGQPFGRHALKALKDLSLGRSVRVEVVDVDTHGRSVGIVFAGGVNINLAMVREGWAWAYRRHLEAPYASEFIAAESEARGRRLGLWRDANPTPPWEFRWRTR